MTQVAFFKKADLPSKMEIEIAILELGYEFEILDDFENFYGIDGLECKLNGEKTFLETYFEKPREITNDFDFIKKDLTDQDTVVSFICGANFAAGASIGLISIGLIDKCNALIYCLDNQKACTKEMLLTDTPEFIEELEKQKKYTGQNQNTKTKAHPKKKGFLNKIKNLFK
ncbi:hypothetical protein [uncultured Aquimarina sp.]|uniref:hypothetical protein n=1 Tax=uncultured Aquimarina sp. TaxID=575652 RepID=UPI00262A32CA|nr:hypothetical protein [uncultured Aquimarina sp.]